MNTPPLLCIALAAALSLSSCDKAERLRAEQASLQAKRSEVMDKLKELDEKFRSLGPNGMSSVDPMESKAAAMKKEAYELETNATMALRKWTGLDKAFVELKARVDAWKGANLQ